MQFFVKQSPALLVPSLLALAITACGGSSNSSHHSLASATITGTAATGAPVIGSVAATDANGTSSSIIPINTDGSFSINVQGLIPPYLLIANDSVNGIDLYSYAEENNSIANVTPLTTMSLALATGKNPALLAADWETALLVGPVTHAEIMLAAQKIYATLPANTLSDTDYNFFSKPFAADGAGLDAVLDTIENFNISTPAGVLTITTTVAGTPGILDLNPNLGTYDFDGDTIPVAQDNCPDIANTNQLDSDLDTPHADGLGDACDNDRDNDGIENDLDSCITADFDLYADVDHDGCDDIDEDTDVILPIWKLVVTGSKCTNGNCVATPTQTVDGLSAPATENQLVEQYATSKPGVVVTIHATIDTDIKQSFTVVFDEVTQPGVTVHTSLVYTYTFVQ